MATNEELKYTFEKEVGKYILSWLRTPLLIVCEQIGNLFWVNLNLKHKCIVLILRDRWVL